MSSLDKVFESIDDYEKQVRKMYPRAKGRVLIANIKSNLDAVIGREDEIKWAIEYCSELKSLLR
jgi:hypothetical protein